MAAGAGFTPSAASKVTTDTVGCYVNALSGLPTAVLYQIDWDTTVTPATPTFTYRDLAGVVLVLTLAEQATFTASPCDRASISATIRIGAGNAANIAFGQDGTSFDFNAYLSTAAVVTAIGGAAVLQAYTIVVEDAANVAGPASANRVDFIEPGNALATGVSRTLSNGESVSADADDSDIYGLKTSPTMTVTCVGVSRALIKILVKRVN